MGLISGWASAELRHLLQPSPSFRVITSKGNVAAALWDYGEDALAAQAIAMTDEDLDAIERIEAWYEDPTYPLPLVGQKITHNHVSAFAAVTYFEGKVRPLARSRRRRQRDRPPEYQSQAPEPGRGPA